MTDAAIHAAAGGACTEAPCWVEHLPQAAACSGQSGASAAEHLLGGPSQRVSAKAGAGAEVRAAAAPRGEDGTQCGHRVGTGSMAGSFLECVPRIMRLSGDCARASYDRGYG